MTAVVHPITGGRKFIDVRRGPDNSPPPMPRREHRIPIMKEAIGGKNPRSAKWRSSWSTIFAVRGCGFEEEEVDEDR